MYEPNMVNGRGKKGEQIVVSAKTQKSCTLLEAKCGCALKKMSDPYKSKWQSVFFIVVAPTNRLRHF